MGKEKESGKLIVTAVISQTFKRYDSLCLG